MFEIRGKNKEKLDEEIKDELEKVRKLSTEDLAKVFGGIDMGDTREEYSMNPEDIKPINAVGISDLTDFYIVPGKKEITDNYTDNDCQNEISCCYTTKYVQGNQC